MQKPATIETAKEVIKQLNEQEQPTRRAMFGIIRKTIKNSDSAYPTALQLWEAYRELLREGMAKNEKLEKAIRVKDVRTDSGVAPLTVLTKPFACPGKCVYCPTEARMPKSYISTEPAAARALSLKFDPYEQVQQRIRVLEMNGHTANKIELIIKGGTWSAYPKVYREWFVMRCFLGANEYKDKEKGILNLEFRISRKENNDPSVTAEGYKLDLTDELLAAQKENETAAYRIIGLTIETRPDWVTEDEVIHLRKLGCTRVELGLQIINDRVLELTKRGTTVEDAARAIALLKSAAFKVDVHMMPGQPGASREDDLDSFKTLFNDKRFRPDMIKLYPCVVMPNTELEAWAKRGEYKPMEGRELRDLLIEMQKQIPYYCRVARMIRDFPSQDIAEGNKESNLREMLEREMKERGIKCKCLRCREVGHNKSYKSQVTSYKSENGIKDRIFEEWYENAGGTEVFLSIEDENREVVFGFCRLRLQDELPQAIQTAFPTLKDAAYIRELHTYGTALNINQQDPKASQHKGFGRRLMERSEKIATEKGYKKMAVISGVGVREYYKTLGYELIDGYMVKDLGQS